MTTDEKLDILIADVAEMKGDLKAHLAVDERMWRQVDENELDIKSLVKDNGKIKTKHAALVATIATALSGGVHVALKALL